MHGLYICHTHLTDYGLDIPLVPLLIVPPGVGRQVADEVIEPVVEPGINGQGVKILFYPLAKSCNVPRRIFFILPLRQPLSAFSAFQVFSLALTPFCDGGGERA